MLIRPQITLLVSSNFSCNWWFVIFMDEVWNLFWHLREFGNNKTWFISELLVFVKELHSFTKRIKQWRPFTQIYSTGVALIPTVVSGAFYYRLDVCNLRKLLLQTQFLSNYPTIIIFYLYNNIPQVNNKCIISCNHLLTCY